MLDRCRNSAPSATQWPQTLQVRVHGAGRGATLVVRVVVPDGTGVELAHRASERPQPRHRPRIVGCEQALKSGTGVKVLEDEDSGDSVASQNSRPEIDPEFGEPCTRTPVFPVVFVWERILHS